jgi:multiple sugar transport system ATP-binding protein
VLHKVGERIWVESHGQQWPVANLAQGEHGQAVHFGVRPSDITVSTNQQGIPATVIVVEPTGAETELLLEVGDARFVVVLHGRTDVQPQDQIFLEIDGAKTHVFDGKTTARLD